MRGFLALEHVRALPLNSQPFLAGDLRDRAFGREVAVEDDEVAVLLIGLSSGRMISGRPDTVARRRGFRHGLPGDGEAVAVEQAGVEQRLHQRPDAADGDEFGHRIFAAGLEVGEHRHALADAREVVERELHFARRARWRAGAARHSSNRRAR